MNGFDVLTLNGLGKARVNRLTRVSRDKAVETATPAKTNVVFVHGFWKGPGDYRRLIQLLMDTTQGRGEVFVYHFRSFRTDAEASAQGLTRELTRLLGVDPQGRLILVGHSLGGALARRAILLLLAGGEGEGGGPGQAIKTDPYDRVERLVLLSSTNRGFEPKSLWMGLGRHVMELADLRSPIVDALRGSKWISDLRLEWIEMFGGVTINPEPASDPDANHGVSIPEADGSDVREHPGVVIPKPVGSNVPAHPKTIQIDGARDRVVRPDDSADMALFASSVRQFVVRGIVHLDFALEGLSEQAESVDAGERIFVSEIDVGALESPALDSLEERDRDHGRQLAELAGLIADAVGGKLDPTPGVKPGPGFGLTPSGPPVPGAKLPACPPGGWWAGGGGGPATYDIVFMIHGIRDYGSWHPILGEALEREVRKATGYWKIVPIEYGYFSALQFLIPIQQRRLVKGFTDRYLNELTRALQAMIRLGVFTRVQLHAATHSNGCNVLAQAITGNDRITFVRVFQAGCVLPRNFWAQHRSRKAAFAVRNDCATLDWPVGVLCKNLGRIPLPAFRFLGPAGVIGFDGTVVVGAPAAPGSKRQFVRNHLSFVGDHGAALEPARMVSIAKYLVADNRKAPILDARGPEPMRGPRFALWFGLITVIGGFLALLVLLGLVAGRAAGLAWGVKAGLVVGFAAGGLGLAAILATIFVIAVLLNF